MTLVFDRTATLGQVPMTHAFLVGVSLYEHLPPRDEPPRAELFNLQQLASPALSAWELCRWLVANADALARPLGTVRILLSPSPEEQPLMTPIVPVNGWLEAQAAVAEWPGFVAAARQWRDSAGKDPANLTLFYYGGHGLQRFGAPLLTLADFGDPLAGGTLARAFELMGNFLPGMAPAADRPNIARTQFYFVDACREDISDPVRLMALPGTVWDPLSGVDDRATPVFMAAFPGQRAMALEGHVTDFATALLRGFDCAAEEPEVRDQKRRYPVTSFTLNRYLENHFEALGTGQYAPATGVSFKDVKLRWLENPPQVEFTIQIDPDQAVDLAHVKLERVGGLFSEALPAARPHHPYVVRAPAGIFELSAADATNTFLLYEETLQINQKVPIWPVAMEAAE